MGNSEDLIKITYDLQKLKDKDYETFLFISNLIKELNKKSRAI